MNPQRITSPIIQATLALLCVMWSMAGWYTFLAASFTTSSKRSTNSTTVNGGGAEFIGVLFIVLGLLGIALLVKNLPLCTANRVLVALVLALAPPLAVQVWLAAA